MLRLHWERLKWWGENDRNMNTLMMSGIVSGFIVAFIFFAFGAGANEISYNSRCIDNMTLEYYQNITVDGTVIPVIIGNQACPNGCEEGLSKYGADCIEPNYILTFEIIIGVIGFLLFMGYILGRK